MPAQTEFPAVFESLKSILQPYAKKLTVKNDTKSVYYLDGSVQREMEEGTVFRLDAHQEELRLVLSHAGLHVPRPAERHLPELKKHMQGKSCFNFKKVEKGLFEELSQLTKKGFERMMREEYS